MKSKFVSFLHVLIFAGIANAELKMSGRVVPCSTDSEGHYYYASMPVIDSSGDWLGFSAFGGLSPGQRPLSSGSSGLVYLLNTETRKVELISKTQSGDVLSHSDAAPYAFHCNASWIQSTGNLVAFTANTERILGIPNDKQPLPATYLWVRDPFQIVAPMPLVDGYAASNQNGEGKLDISGQFVFYSSSKRPEFVMCENTDFNFGTLYRQNWRTGEVKCLGRNEFGQTLNREVRFLEASSDGRYILMECSSTNIFNNEEFASDQEYKNSDPGWQNLIVQDIENGENDLITMGFDGEIANNNNNIAVQPWRFLFFDLTLSADMSDDARIVSFWSRASNLDPNAASAWAHVYVFDRQTREMKAIADLPELPWQGRTTTGAVYGYDPVGPYWTRVSGDGRFVFYGEAEYNYNELKIYRYNTVTSKTDVVLNDNDVPFLDMHARFSTPSVNYDGSVVAFSSQSNNLVPGMAPLNDWKVFLLQLPVEPASTTKSWDRLR
ncbi:MAG: hypothetical protein GC154_17205 [bacterium]|nr:hypothetical protein [bacterium]